MSQTPRTDAKAQFFGFNPDEGEEFVQADFARELEREYAELQEKVDDWENATLGALDHRPDEKHCTCVPPLIGKVRQLERENAALRAAAVEVCAVARVWVTVWGDKLSTDSLQRFEELEQQILKKAQP